MSPLLRISKLWQTMTLITCHQRRTDVSCVSWIYGRQKKNMRESSVHGGSLIPISLLPIMATSYFFQYLDKSALGSTAILGLRHDLGLSGSDYSWSSSIYYFGYIVASYPAGVVMIRWRVGKAITASMLVFTAFDFLHPCNFSRLTFLRKSCMGLYTDAHGRLS